MQYGVFRRALGWRVQTLPPFPHRARDTSLVLCQLRGSVLRER